MEWFRFYHEAVDDPKVQRLSPQLFKHWINILCLSSRNSERGSVPSCSDLAFGLRVSEGKVAAIIGSLMDAGLIDRTGETLRIHAWESRQKRSDNVAERVAKYRAGNEPVTLHETLPHVRVTETEQNRDRTEAEQIPPLPPSGGERQQNQNRS